MFHKKKWEIYYIAEIIGQYKDVQIIFRNLPCRINTSSGKKKYLYNDFSCELYEVLIDHMLDDFSCVKSRIESDGFIKETITLKNYRNIEVLLILDKSTDRKKFYHNIGEAIIDAFSKAGITV